MKLIVATGMLGAGKTIALKMLEDLGFYYVDNLSIPLVDKFAQLITAGNDISQVTLDIDIRNDEELGQLDAVLRGWRELGMDYQTLLLGANDGVLIKRYKETRRSRPLAGTGRLDKGAEKERVELALLKKDANFITDINKLLTRELQQELEKILLRHQECCSMSITVLSFGFKYDTPEGADLVFDACLLPSPYYSEDLRLLTREDQSVRDYVMQEGTYAQFLDKLYDMMDLLLPNHINEGESQLVVAVGCIEGKHHSVVVARALCAHLTTRIECGVKIEHRDIDKNNKRE